jgi:hypothetical protein
MGKKRSSAAACELVSTMRTGDTKNRIHHWFFLWDPTSGAEKSGENGLLLDVTSVGQSNYRVAKKIRHLFFEKLVTWLFFRKRALHYFIV